MDWRYVLGLQALAWEIFTIHVLSDCILECSKLRIDTGYEYMVLLSIHQ